jgi:hypothetical protein
LESSPSFTTFETRESDLTVLAFLRLQPNGSVAVLDLAHRPQSAWAGLAVGFPSSGGGRLDIWHNAASDAVEARLDAVEKNLTMVRDQLHELERETEKRLEHQIKALEQEKQDRAKVDEDIREKLKTSAVGGLHISAVGVAWLSVGVIMSTGSIELAHLFQRFLP